MPFRKFFLQKFNRSIYLTNRFFQMLVVIFMRQINDKELNFLPSASESYLSLHFLRHCNQVETYVPILLFLFSRNLSKCYQSFSNF